jgi:hypothetical protein
MNSPFRGGTGPQAPRVTPSIQFNAWRDGTSNQIIIGEKHIPQDLLGQDTVEAADVDGSFLGTGDIFVWPDGGLQFWEIHSAGEAGGTRPAGRFNIGRSIITQAPRLARGHNDSPGVWNLNQPVPEYGFGSYHSGISNFLLGDGSVRAVSNTIGAAVLGAYANTRSGESPGSL